MGRRVAPNDGGPQVDHGSTPGPPLIVRVNRSRDSERAGHELRASSRSWPGDRGGELARLPMIPSRVVERIRTAEKRAPLATAPARPHPRAERDRGGGARLRTSGGSLPKEGRRKGGWAMPETTKVTQGYLDGHAALRKQLELHKAGVGDLHGASQQAAEVTMDRVVLFLDEEIG